MRGLSGKYHPLHLGAAAGAVVDGEDRALDLLVPVRGLEAGGQLPAEHGDALLPPDAQDRVKAPGHAHVGDVARPPGEDALVGGGDMGVGAPDGGGPPRQVIAHGQLFRGGLGVKIQEEETL